MNALSQHLVGIPQLHPNPVSKAPQEFSEVNENALFSEELASFLAVTPASTALEAGPHRGENGLLSTTKGPIVREPGAADVLAGSPLVVSQSGNTSPPEETIDGKSLPLNINSLDRPASLAAVSNPEAVKFGVSVHTTPGPVGNVVDALAADRTPTESIRVANAATGLSSIPEKLSTKAVPLSLDGRIGNAVPGSVPSKHGLTDGQTTQSISSASTAISADDTPARENAQAHKSHRVDTESRFANTVALSQRAAGKPAPAIPAGSRPAVVESGGSSPLPTNPSAAKAVELIRSAQAAAAEQSNSPAGVNKPLANASAPTQLPTLEQPIAAVNGQATPMLTSAKPHERPIATGKAEVLSIRGKSKGESFESADLPLATSATKILVSAKAELPAFNHLTPAKSVAANPILMSDENHHPSNPTEESGTTPVQLGSSIANSTVNPRSTIAGNFASLQFGDPQFQRNFNDQVLLMAGQGIQKAHLSLNPQELGPVEIRLAMQNDEISVQLASTNALVREALEQALPRLREMFEQTGLKLVDQQVAGQFSEQSGSRSFTEQNQRGHQISTEFGESPAAGEMRPVSTSRGLVDTYI